MTYPPRNWSRHTRYPITHAIPIAGCHTDATAHTVELATIYHRMSLGLIRGGIPHPGG
jgi:hypothetical protein